MPDKQRTFGQFETPADVADLLLSYCLRRPDDRLLDPGCGTGAFLARASELQSWLADEQADPNRLWGVELDPQAAAEARALLPGVEIMTANFFAISPEEMVQFDALVGNPPYTRAEWIDRLLDDGQLGHQLTMFGEPDDSSGPEPHRQRGLLNRRAGLHAHFLVHGTAFLRDHGRLGFVVPNSWLDVAYGERLKQFLVDHYKILAVIESNVERWFDRARVNTCLVVLEKCGDRLDRAANQVRLIQLRRPLQALIPYESDDTRRWPMLERLSLRLLPSDDVDGSDFAARVVTQSELQAVDRWGFALRAPAVYRRVLRKPELAPLSAWASIQRGYTTGVNSFFYLDAAELAHWGLENRFHRPLLKSLRSIDARRLTETDCDLEVLSIPPTASLAGTSAGAYVAWGESQGWHLRRTCASRRPWYTLPVQKPGELLLPKGIWERHFAPLVDGGVLVDQQLYQVHLADGVPPQAAAALLNSTWFGLQLELHGRINFGEGVLWLAAYELHALRLPDPRYLPPTQLDELGALFVALSQGPVKTAWQAQADPIQRALDGFVFALLGMTPDEGAAITRSFLERLRVRQVKAKGGERAARPTADEPET